MNLENFLWVSFIVSLLVFCSVRKHLLLTLLSLEYIVLLMFLGLFLFLVKSGSGLFFLMVFLVFSVCKGCLGLSLLISLIRSHGNDMLSSLGLLKW